MKYRLFNALLCTAALSFIIYFLVLCRHIRPVSDDIQFFYFLKQKGYWGSLAYFYEGWSFRWPSTLYFNTVFLFAESFRAMSSWIFGYYCFTLIFFITTVSLFLHYFFLRFFSRTLSFFNLSLYATFFIASFYFLSFQSNEVWLWVLGSFEYLYSFIFCLLGTAFLLKEKSTTGDYIVIVISFAYAGGTLQNNALVFIIGLFALLIYLIRSKGIIDFFKSVLHKKIVLALITLSIALSVNLSGKGTGNRLGKETLSEIARTNVDPASNPSIADTIRSITMQRKNILGCLLLLPWMLLGARWRKENVILSMSSARIVGGGLLTLAVVAVITVAPVIFIFHSAGPLRSWSPLSLFLVVVLCVWSFFIGNRLGADNQWLRRGLTAGLALYIIIQTIYTVRHQPMAASFSRAFDTRCEYLLELEKSGNKETVTLDPLPIDGPLIQADIDTDEEEYANQLLAETMGLHFKVRRK